MLLRLKHKSTTRFIKKLILNCPQPQATKHLLTPANKGSAGALGLRPVLPTTYFIALSASFYRHALNIPSERYEERVACSGSIVPYEPRPSHPHSAPNIGPETRTVYVQRRYQLKHTCLYGHGIATRHGRHELVKDALNNYHQILLQLQFT